MKSHRLELFWAEKVKIAQFIIQSQEETKVPAARTHPQTLRQIVNNDQRFQVFLKFSLAVSSWFPFPPATDFDIEKDLTEIRDIYGAPAIPSEISEIYIRRAEFLQWDPSSPLSDFYSQWKSILSSIETSLSELTEEREACSRYISLRGLRTLVGGVNLSTMRNYILFLSR